jgi:hypothetical protein
MFLGFDGYFVHLLHALTFCLTQNLVFTCSQFTCGAAIHGLIDIKLSFYLSSVVTTLVYKDLKCAVPFMAL